MAAWRDLARRAESLGYATLYIPDHFGDQFGPLVALTVAAEATTTLGVGSLVLDNDYRHPVVLAKEIATLDLASQGRLEVGLGAGWQTSDYEEAGLPYDPPKERIDRMVEGLAVMRGLWEHETFTFSGEHYTVTAAQGQPRPCSQPHPPVRRSSSASTLTCGRGGSTPTPSPAPTPIAGTTGSDGCGTRRGTGWAGSTSRSSRSW
jgi:probable F420-dependent oxidoreductase